jgi:hypothetical protein
MPNDVEYRCELLLLFESHNLAAMNGHKRMSS